jgi:hypothetical protein
VQLKCQQFFLDPEFLDGSLPAAIRLLIIELFIID